MSDLKTETMTLNMGPQHPSTHGVFRLQLEVDGETIVRATPVMGYLHRGSEKLAEGFLYSQFIPYTDRLDYMNAMTNNYVYCAAIEELFDWEIPERAEYLRVITMELNRVASHLVWWGTYLLDIGAMSPFLYAFRDRETILDRLNEISGARMTFNYHRIGGVKWDAPEGWIEQVLETVKELRENIQEFHTLVTGNEIFQSRTIGVGKLTKEQVINWGLSGPIARASGVDIDVRKTEPYSVYDQFDFNVPTREEGDVYARYLVRIDEMFESLKIVEQACNNIPDGEIIHKKGKKLMMLKPPEGEVYTRAEASKGEIGVYAVSNGKNKPHRIKLRRPSFVNVAILQDLLEGDSIQNLVSIFGSLDVVLGEVDG
ncbi:NADH-quinone oxidoreductase subunit D [Salisediminibacterium halotolerans]|uniref:NADH-quinone oxidoreductase subunit D n=1 Tax=Salisediminibacterium halotolerans TaxID=517425 RepID=A0A1H9QNY2_9BACI|nr:MULTISPECIES: NADH-quinone oxidoreductase subunit D [Salisediminibacterium]RLJ75790.1 NADH dehydrogenase subunit D [Actinophytocola xinjiangensis]RPE89644.1 NADH dehydrogenase subunit D [Salisediminibacterium halotolerans]TWG36403.1 NADH dehydrogenase subunit D [Salisediminibacterium halotolerans]SER62216.1 NADH-quinone oxidoreductase subunit D [Salisediminibacterium haloalkalitolerans]GEL07519.1 NADH-quinone oxidoreductase subunit D [Salisediminibacterium halotolerans]